MQRDDDEDGNCPTCGGDGVIDVDTCDGRGEHVSTTEPCPRCGDADPQPDAGDFYDDEGPDPEADDFDRYPY
jgi:hypothetical protein